MGLDMFLHKRTYVFHYEWDTKPKIQIDYPGIKSERVDLKNLADTVDQVLADHSLASELLPTQGGFFFGDIDYGEYYFEDLELTKKICKTALADAEGGDFYYEASW